MVNNGIIQRHGERESITYDFFEQSYNNVVVATDTPKPSLGNTSQVMEVVIWKMDKNQEDGQGLAVPDVSNITESDAEISVLKDITPFKKFQKAFEKKVLIWIKL